MSTTRLALLLHPVRMRLVNALSAGGTLTTAELCDRLPDQPQATVYRHVARLAQGGVFEVASQRRARGAIERCYRLARGAMVLDPDAVRAMSLEDHRRGFTAGMAAILAEFNAYLDRGGADPLADGVSYKQFTLWLSPAERRGLVRDIRRLLLARMENPPRRGRAPHLLGTIFFPTGVSHPGRTAAPSTRRRSTGRT
jgi:DNA-binding transcriptional ArsR family regulator